MTLELEITSYHRLSPTVEAKKRFAPKTQTIGRSDTCYWQLPDPDRAVSSKHAQINWREGQYWLRDTSTNGVFVNNSEQPLGRDQEVVIQADDHFRIGDYEIVVSSSELEPKPKAISNTVINTANQAPTVVKTAARPIRVEAPVFSESRPAVLPETISSLSEYDLLDSHVNLPKAIPTDWGWQEKEDKPEPKPQPITPTNNHLITVLLESMGVKSFFENAQPDTHFMSELGTMVRVLLDNVLDLLHMRAEQKQQLRVQQTTFKRTENNPLKFSASSQDAVEALLLKRHPSFLQAEQAINEAFVDIQTHEKALLSGIEAVINELLVEPKRPAGGFNNWPIIGKALAYEQAKKSRAHYLREYSDINQLLRSEIFVEAYEHTIKKEKENAR